MTNHAEMTTEYWLRFTLDQQILMIGNEMNRASKFMSVEDAERRKNCYERALRLADLTLEVQPNRSLRRELLLWREFVADLNLRRTAEPEAHNTAFKCLLCLTPEAAKQVAFLNL